MNFILNHSCLPSCGVKRKNIPCTRFHVKGLFVINQSGNTKVIFDCTLRRPIMPLGTVVVVDDEEMITKPVKRLLNRYFKDEGLDYQVITSISPEEALAYIENDPLDVALVISDVMMEQMNGLEFLQAVNVCHPTALMIVLTGYTDTKTFNALNQQLELYSYQQKPWDDQQLIHTVKNALNLYRRKMLLSRYVPEEIIEQVLNHPDNKVLEGTELEATILFLDIRDSTSLFSSKQMGPKKALNHLNQYFEEFLTVLNNYDGILDKFMGDGIMALFGVPFPSSHPAEDAKQAVRAALEMRQAANRLNQKNKTFPLSIGVGISTGQVIAGNIGTTSRANYTVLGRDVNIASRLEKAADSIPDGILISGSTYKYVDDMIDAVPYPLVEDDALAKKKGNFKAYEVKSLKS
ncbi:MAG: response regulator [Chloroflexi bacterium]|nr:response regulator [Chloroflexota bacterium]